MKRTEARFVEAWEVVYPCIKCGRKEVKIDTIRVSRDRDEDRYSCVCSNCNNVAGEWISLNAARSAWNQWNFKKGPKK